MKNLLSFLLLSFLLFQGCTVLGFIGGSLLTEDTNYYSDSKNMITLEPGQTIEVQTDQNLYKGEFKGFVRRDFDLYEISYNEKVHFYKDQVTLPSLGEEEFSKYLINFVNEDVHLKELLLTKKKFYGFDFSSILFSDSTYENAVNIPLSLFSKTDSSNSKFSLDAIVHLLKMGKLPLVTKIVVAGWHYENKINGEDIIKIDPSDFSINPLIGLVVGIGLDYLTIKIIQSSIRINAW